jgi:hypothetical protein
MGARTRPTLRPEIAPAPARLSIIWLPHSLDRRVPSRSFDPPAGRGTRISTPRLGNPACSGCPKMLPT